MVGVKKEKQKEQLGGPVVIDFFEYRDRKGIESENQQIEYVSIISNQIHMLKPIDCDEMGVLVECLKNGETVIINLADTEIRKRQKVMDFICGACYVLKGKIYHVTDNIFVVGFSKINSED